MSLNDEDLKIIFPSVSFIITFLSSLYSLCLGTFIFLPLLNIFPALALTAVLDGFYSLFDAVPRISFVLSFLSQLISRRSQECAALLSL